MGCWNKQSDEKFRIRIKPRFLSNIDEQSDLVDLQAKQLEKIKKETEE